MPKVRAMGPMSVKCEGHELEVDSRGKVYEKLSCGQLKRLKGKKGKESDFLVVAENGDIVRLFFFEGHLHGQLVKFIDPEKESVKNGQ